MDVLQPINPNLKTMNHKSQTPSHQLSAISCKLILVALGCFALLPKAQAVVPPPDGGYPNFTTAEGTNALKNLTTGAANTAIGWYSLFSDTSGGFNTALGAGTLLFNNADSNTAVGTAALLLNTTGGFNTAVGTTALLNNTRAATTPPAVVLRSKLTQPAQHQHGHR